VVGVCHDVIFRNEVQGCMRDEGKAPRNRLIGAGCKPPQAAEVKSLGGER